MQLFPWPPIRLSRALWKGPKAPARIAQIGTVEGLENYLARSQRFLYADARFPCRDQLQGDASDFLQRGVS